jgi:hypothetical protein
MKTLTTSIILSVMFLSAGAFAGSNHGTHPATVATADADNVTVIEKNASWPPAGHISVEPCSRARCIDI